MTKAEEIYGDIINLPHHVSKRHPQMSIENRAAQFAPFAALVGYDDALNETQRTTENKKQLSDDKIEELNRKIQILKQGAINQVQITYFVPDEKKTGGSYSVHYGIIKRIDDVQKSIIFTDNKTIKFDEVLDIEIQD